jgi:hypothetical protein
MSVIAYARMTRRRELSRPLEPGSTLSQADDTTPTPVGKATIDAFAALVPAEILVAHAAILQVTTKTNGAVTTITEKGTLQFAFWALTLVAALIYLITKAPKLNRLDVIRVLIPPAAFVGWTMVQKTTAFSAVFSMNEAMRITVPIIAALLISAIAAALAYKADEEKV